MSDLEIDPGQKIVFLDHRQFGGDPFQQQAWETTLREAFHTAGMNLEVDPTEWVFRWATLPAGDTLLAVGREVDPTNPDDQGPNYSVIMISEEKWTPEDVHASTLDGRLFGPDNEIQRISEAGAKDNQYVFAYVECEDMYGEIQSLARDYSPILYQITSWRRYAAFVAKFAKRWDHVPSRKAGNLKRKKVDVDQAKRYFLGYLFTDAIAAALLAKFASPEAALEPLKTVTFTPKGTARVPKEYKDILGMGAGRVARAFAIYCPQPAAPVEVTPAQAQPEVGAAQ